MSWDKARQNSVKKMLGWLQAPRSIALGFAHYVLLVVAQLGKNP